MVWRTGAHQLLERKSWYAVRDGDWKWVQPPDQSGMLFDLARDPNEMVDLSDKHPDKSRQLRMMATE